MAIKSRNSVGAVIVESVSGVASFPSAATDYIPLQDGEFELSPSFNELENAELRASIGKAKPVLGLEEPSGTISQYLKHSGIEGQEPQLGRLIQSAFGSKEVNATQHVTVAASTVSVIKVGVGIGANFTVGESLLIKDPVNGFSIRTIKSISGDNLTLNFNLALAPGASVGLGKAVKYLVSNSGHPTLSVWLYRGNDGAVEMLAGSQVSAMNMEVSAGEFVSCSFDFDGTKYHFDPIRTLSADTKLDFTDSVPTTYAATVQAKTWRDPYELASALQASMNSLGSLDIFSVNYNSIDGKFSISSNGSAFQLLWNTGVNTANTIGDKLGFLTAANDTGASVYPADNAQTWNAPQTPSYDSAEPLAAKNMEVLLGSPSDLSCIGISEFTFALENTLQTVTDICAESGVEERIITERTVTCEFTARLRKHDAQTFKRFRAGDDVGFQFSFGEKAGGNWIAGKSGCVTILNGRLSAFQVTSNDGIETITGTVTGFVNAQGDGEASLNFV